MWCGIVNIMSVVSVDLLYYGPQLLGVPEAGEWTTSSAGAGLKIG